MNAFKLSVFGLVMILMANFSSMAQDGVLVDPLGGTKADAAVFEAKSTTQGMLVPRVTLSALGTFNPPISGGAPVTSLLVYNTGGTLDAGYYYWDGSTWQRLISGSGTIPTISSGITNYLARWTSATALGTGVSYDDGIRVGIGTTSPRNSVEIANTDGTNTTSLRIGGITSGNIGAALGAETSRHQLLFSSWRDAQTNTIGAKIVGINKAVYGGTPYFVQNTDLAFYTLSSTPGSTDATTEKMRLLANGNLGIGTATPGGKLEIEGDFYNQELVGGNIHNSDQTVSYNAAATTIDLGTTDYVRVAKGDGSGANNSSILVVASVTVSGNDISFADGIGLPGNSTPSVLFLMNGTASFTVSLQRRINAGAWTTLIRQSAICGLGVGDWYTQANSIANMQGKHGDEFRFPNSVSISYFDDPGNGNVDYQLVFTPGGNRKNGGSYLISDRNLTAVQIKR